MTEGPRLSRPRARGAAGHARGRDGLWIYEGALSFLTTICSSYGDSPYKRE
jgi:hypothetical protein